MKTCSKCRIEKPATEFTFSKKRPDGLHSWCKFCSNTNRRAWYKQNKDVFRKRNKLWDKANPEKVAARIKRYRNNHPRAVADASKRYRERYPEKVLANNLRRKYGITPEIFKDLKKKQSNKCAICQDTPKGKQLSIDHDHNDGIVRGLLCSNCNRGLGSFRDSPGLLQKAITYLTDSSTKKIFVIGLLAERGHGKTSVANYLRDKYDAKIISLAAPIKRIAKKIMSFTDEQLYGTQEQKEAVDPRYGFSARKFLQLLGTEGLRDEFWPNVHIDALIANIKRMNSKAGTPQVYVVDDCRFPNEAAFFASKNENIHSALIKIVCTDVPPPAKEVAEHASERYVREIPESLLTATISSSLASGLEDLYTKVDWVIDTFPRLAPFRRVLKRGAARKVAA